MAAATLKDYYKILDIPHEATAPEIKKAYRVMAFKYHPDTAAQRDAYTQHYFNDIQEAYDTLGDEYRRKQYDNERWLAGMTERARNKAFASPIWILQETIKLANHIETVDVYRMNHRALHDYILQLLDSHQMAMLATAGEPSVNEGIINMLLQATRGLKFVYMQPVAARLHALSGADAQLQHRINTAIQHRKNQAVWEKRMPWAIALITMALLGLMYIWVTK